MKSSKKIMRIFRDGGAIVLVLSLIPIIVEILSLAIMWVVEHALVFGLFMLFIAVVASLGMFAELFRDPDDDEEDEETFWEV